MLESMLADKDWDAPFFKVLARNDTSHAPGHQGGIVVPTELRIYFPLLNELHTSSTNPTVDQVVGMEMYVGQDFLGRADVRYQFQTWGGKRSPESRITENLGPLRDAAHAGDILLFQRHTSELRKFRLILLPAINPAFSNVFGLVGQRRSGPLLVNELPVTLSEIALAERQLTEIEEEPFVTLRSVVPRVASRQERIVRCTVFPARVLKQYQRRCCVSDFGLTTVGGLREVEAAHVVPVSEGGLDDVRNGLALTQTLHWAFDHGLFGIQPSDRRVVVPEDIQVLNGNEFLKGLHGKTIGEGLEPKMRVHSDALEWHLKNVVARRS